MHRFLVSAAHKSSGKTTLSIGLCAALKQRGLSIQPFKKGPDYIDPLWLGRAAGRPCRNLDFFLSPDEEIKQQFGYGHDADVCLVEGNKGLYDGLALEGGNSNAALARLLDLPVILIIDARGMTRGIAPLILGYQAFERDIRIAGVILNRLGGSRHEAKLRAVIEHYTEVPVLGAVHENDDLALVERHLGLMPANEAAGADTLIATIAAHVATQVDLPRLLSITATDKALPCPAPRAATSATMATTVTTTVNSGTAPLRLAIAQDDAFGFYYSDDLAALEAAGAQLLPFDTLHDASLPPCDALFIGGGFPETFLDALSANSALRADIRQRIEAGLPTYAECGGLMYLAQSITWRDQTRPMVGVIPGDIVMHAKPVGRGYVILDATPDHPWRQPDASTEPNHGDSGHTNDGQCRPASADFWPNEHGQGSPAEAGTSSPCLFHANLHAHEFHYSELRNLPDGLTYAYHVKRGHGIDGERDGLVLHQLLASYTHLRGVAASDWPAQFIAFARRCRTTFSATP